MDKNIDHLEEGKNSSIAFFIMDSIFLLVCVLVFIYIKSFAFLACFFGIPAFILFLVSLYAVIFNVLEVKRFKKSNVTKSCNKNILNDS